MGTILPQGLAAKVEFVHCRLGVWAERAEAMGSSPDAVAAVEAATAAAKAAREAQELAHGLAMAATLRFRSAVATLQKVGGDVIQQVKLKAAMDDDVAPYTLALLDVPAAPAPLGPPGTPSNFETALRPDGSLELRWRCKNPKGSSGTVYQVARQLDGAGPFVVLDTIGRRRFVDDGLPIGGFAWATYQVTAIRSTRRGAPAQFLFRVGRGGQAAPQRAA